MKRIWAIGGFDPSGGAGILADCTTAAALGVACFAIATALTAQNGLTLSYLKALSNDEIKAQWMALKALGWPEVIKIGLLPNAETAACVFECLKTFKGIIIYDPVMIASCGQSLIQADFLKKHLKKWMHQITLLTPNLIEASTLVNFEVNDVKTMQKAAKLLCQQGIKNVLIKGGHFPGETLKEIWVSAKNETWLESSRIAVQKTHGTGCMYSTLLASLLALGYEQKDAWVFAKMLMQQALKNPLTPLKGLQFPKITRTCCYEDVPKIRDTAQSQKRAPFLRCQAPIGFYPIVDNVKWVAKLAKWGAKSCQLRLKGITSSERYHQIKEAIEVANQYAMQLFINDDWELGIELNAYGVHLGQEDLKTCDLYALQKAGIRLGISTHNYEELASALVCQPSYIALGPIYATTSKKMRFLPQGIERLKEWRTLTRCQLVAIGGITLQNLPSVLTCQVDGAAVISALTHAQDPFSAYQQFTSIIRSCPVK